VSVYSSGDWVALAGREDDFARCWQNFLEWVRATADGFESGYLLRDDADPHHFVSIAVWRDAEARADWGAQPEAGQRMRACAALCARTRPGTYQLVFSVEEA
jgi:heme-degrading monooxygenase HmoA